MRIEQSLLYLGILFSRQQDIIPLTDEEKSQIEDYSYSTTTVTTISDEASNIKSMSKTEAVRTCGRIRDQLQLLIKATETAISKIENKEEKIKQEILKNESQYAKDKELIKIIPKIEDIKNKIKKNISQIKFDDEDVTRRWHANQFRNVGECMLERDRLRSLAIQREQENVGLEKSQKALEERAFQLDLNYLLDGPEMTLRFAKEYVAEIDAKQPQLGKAKVELSKANSLLKNTLQKYKFLSDDIKLIREFFDEGILEESQIDDFVEDLKTIQASLPKLEN